MTDTRRSIVELLEGGPVSGPAIADRLDVTRAAVWKHVEALRAVGFEIESTPGGYRLGSVPEYGSAVAIEAGLSAPYRIEYHDTIDSTNARARDLAENGRANVVVAADEQTGGRGRLDRSWVSPSGGIWLSIVCRPDRPPSHAPLYTLAAAVAVTRAVRSLGVDATIKWPNDVIVESPPDDEREGLPSAADRGGSKLCGVLTETRGEADRIEWLIVGIGLNANVDSADLPDGSSSLQSILGRAIDRGALVRSILESFDTGTDDLEAVLDEWRTLSATIGSRVRIRTADGTIEGTAIDVTHPGALVVETDRGTETVHAGDCEHLRPE